MQETFERDEALVLRAKAGDSVATETLLNRYKNLVRARARGFFLVDGEPDDLIQEGMIGIYSAILDYRENAGMSFKSFVYLCVSRKIFDAVKKSCNKGERYESSVFVDPDFAFASEELSPEEWLISAEAQTEFWGKMSKVLSDFEFRIISMYLKGMSYSEISDGTGKSLKSIDNAIQRSKRKLKEAFARNYTSQRRE